MQSRAEKLAENNRLLILELEDRRRQAEIKNQEYREIRRINNKLLAEKHARERAEVLSPPRASSTGPSAAVAAAARRTGLSAVIEEQLLRQVAETQAVVAQTQSALDMERERARALRHHRM